MSYIKFFVIFFIACSLGFLISYLFFPQSYTIEKDCTAVCSSDIPPIVTEVNSDDSSLISKNNFKIPVLMYHHVRKPIQPDSKLDISLSLPPDQFDQQINFLKRMGYSSILMEDAVADVKQGGELGQVVVLTFDDGYDDIFTNALPIMEKYGMVGTIYVIVDDLDKPGYLTRMQVKELIGKGFEIGSHTLTHPNLANTNKQNAIAQIKNSKNILDEAFSYEVVSFCYPSGKLDDQAIEILEDAGYTSAVTTADGFFDQKADIFKIPRKRITGTNILAKFAYDILLPIGQPNGSQLSP